MKFRLSSSQRFNGESAGCVTDPVTGQVTGQLAVRAAPPVTQPVNPPVTGEFTGQVTGQVEAQEAQVTTQVTTQVAEQVAKVLRAAVERAPREQLQEAMGLQNREHFRQTYLEPLVTGGWLERTVPDKPTSRLQKYRLTEKGRAWLAAGNKEGKK